MVIEQLDRTGPSQTPARDNDRDSLVGLYFRDASRYQILTEDQEKRLSRRLSLCFRVIHRELALPEDAPHTFREIIGSLGDAGALTTRCRRAYHLSLDCRRTLIQSNLRLAVHIARRFGQHGIPMPDLIQDANVGLIKAAERFDPSKGFRFSTYAYWWISEEVKRCLQRGVRVVHTPEGVVDEIRELQRVSLRLNRALGREPSQAELAREMEALPSRIGELRALASREVSTDAPLLDDSSITLGDSLAGSSRMTPDHPMAERDRRRALRAMLAELTERERDILARRFGLDLPAPETLQVISDNLGISRERVRQIEKGALKKLQSRFVRLDEAYGA